MTLQWPMKKALHENLRLAAAGGFVRRESFGGMPRPQQAQQAQGKGGTESLQAAKQPSLPLRALPRVGAPQGEVVEGSAAGGT